MQVDLVVRAKTLKTMDARIGDTDRMAILFGRVVAVGEDVDGLRARETVDLGAATVLPGFNDAHCHPVAVGQALAELDLSACRDLDHVYELVADRARSVPPGEWIVGSRYDQTKLGGHPTRDALDRVAPGHPVWLKHTSVHMCVASSALLASVGLLDGSVQVPEGGRVDLTSGLVEEQAQRVIRDQALPLSEEQVAEALDRATSLAVSQGVASWSDAGVGAGWIGHSTREIGGYMLARETGRLPIRTTLMVSADAVHAVKRHNRDHGAHGLDLGIRTGLGDEWLRIGSLKVFTDGSLLGRTAAMTEDYESEPGNRGYLQESEESLRSRIIDAHLAGWQLAVHAIGDRGVEVALEAFEAAQQILPRAETRHRIEHAGVVSDTQLARMVAQRLIPVPQGEFIGAIGDGMVAALGWGRVGMLYRQRSFLEAGLELPGSSDRPVVPGAPLSGIRDLVVRRTGSGEALAPQERLTVEQAVRAWTVGSAYAEGTEADKGTLAPGMLADFVALEQNPFEVPEEDVADVAVLGTWIGGQRHFG
jgi:predicted amidohydrolase YtcJ